MKQTYQWLRNMLSIILVITMVFLTMTIAIENTSANETEESTVSLNEEPTIIAEISKNRDAYVKCFELDNGESMLVQYNEPVHYKNAKGEWVDYNNKLVLAEDILAIEEESDIDNNDKPIELVTEKITEEITEIVTEKVTEKPTEEILGQTPEVIVEEALNDNTDAFDTDISDTNIEEYSTEKEEIEKSITQDANDFSDETVQKEYKNKKSNVGIRLTENSLSKNIVKIKSHNYKIAWGFKNAQESNLVISEEKLELEGNDKFIYRNHNTQKAMYKNIFKEVDIEYYLNSASIKENIILKSNEAQKEFEVQYRFKGLTAVLRDEKTIEFLNKKKEVVYTLTAPIMVDDNGEISDKIELTITESKKNSTIIKISVDENWLNESGRKYPVIIDPDLEFECNQPRMESRGIIVGDTSGNYLSPEQTIGKNGNYQWQFIFKINELPEISKGDIVTSAKIDFMMGNSSNKDIIVYAHNVTSEVPIGEVTGANTTFDGNILDYTVVKAENYIYQASYDVTKTVRGWYEGENNNGILLESNEITDAAVAVASVMHYRSEFRPVFKMTYRNFKGTEDYLTYHTHQTGVKGTTNISDFTGNLVSVHPLFMGTGSRMPVTINLTYNSFNYNQVFENGSPSGYGWQFSFNQYIKLANQELQGFGYKYIYTDANGNEHYFKKFEDSETIWVDEDNSDLRIEEDGDYLYIRGNVEQKYANPENGGVLLSETDGYNNTITYLYTNSNQLTKITDGAGREYHLEYSINTDNNKSRVSKIISPDGGEIVLAYTTSSGKKDRLSRITYPGNERTNFTYDTNHRLNYIGRGSLGESVTYLYDTKGRIIQMREYGESLTIGGCINISYNYDSTTTFSDLHNRSETYIFNQYGETTSVMNGNKYAVNTIENKEGLKINSTSNDFIKNYFAPCLPSSASGFTKKGWNNNNTGIFIADNSSEHVEDESVQYLGSHSLKIEQMSEADITTFYRTISANGLAGKTMTFSSYLKTNNLTEEQGKGAFIKIRYLNSANEEISTHEGNVYHGSYKYRRISETFNIPINASKIEIHCGLKETIGVAWFDAFQLEEGECMNDFNILQNSDFTLSGGWQGNQTLAGSSTEKRKTSQTQRINKNNVTFEVSGLAEGNSVPLTDERSFGINFKIYYENITEPESHYISYDSQITGKQSMNFQATPLDPTQIVDYIEYEFTYNYNIGDMTAHNAMVRVVEIPEVIAQSVASLTDEEPSDEPGVLTEYEGIIQTQDSYGNTLSTKSGIINLVNDEETLDMSKPYTIESDTYDSTGNYLVAETDTRGKTSSYTVDSNNGNILTVTDPNGNVVDYSYLSGTDQLSRVSASSGLTATDYTYDSVGRVKKITRNGFNYTFTYDAFGKQTSISIGGDLYCTSEYFSYNGLLKKTIYANGHTFEYVYDDYDRITSIKCNNEEIYGFAFDKSGQLIELRDIDADTITKYVYNTQGDIINMYKNDDFVFLEDSDGSSDKTIGIQIGGVNQNIAGVYIDEANYQLKNNGWTNHQEENRDHTVVRTTTNGTSPQSFSAKYKSAINTQTNQQSNIVDEIEYKNGSIPLVNYSYEFDNNGNITKTYENGQLVEKFSYNHLNQIREYTNTKIRKYFNYNYDNGGNIHSANVQPLDPTFGYPTGTPYGPVFYYNNTSWKDKLTGFNADTITYDEVGNPLNYRDNITLVWHRGKQLKSFQKGSTVVEYQYNLEGQRTSKTVGNDVYRYYYDEDDVIIAMVKNDDETIHFYYDTLGYINSISYNEQRYYCVKNLQHDITKLIDDSGDVVANYIYDPWGNTLSVTDSDGTQITDSTHIALLNPIRYRNYFYDTESGFYYLNSRYYDPVTSRFINADEYVDTGTGLLNTNMFAYCGNNPVSNVDPDGDVYYGLIGDSENKYASYSFIRGYDYFRAPPKYNTSFWGVQKFTENYKLVDIHSGNERTYKHLPNNQYRANCYMYAINIIWVNRLGAYNYGPVVNGRITNKIPDYMHPGFLSGKRGEIYSDNTKMTIQNSLINSFKNDMKKLKINVFTGIINPKKSYKVAAVYATGEKKDYHWYRTDSGTNYWSHKRGMSTISQRDASFKYITNPKSANRNYSDVNYNSYIGIYTLYQ